MAHDGQELTDGWNTYSNWIDTIKDNSPIIQQFEQDQCFRQKLNSCSTNLERFALIWSGDEFQQAILKTEIERIHKQQLKNILINSNQYRKSSSESKKFRELGNNCFKQANYNEALKYYTQAVLTAPYPQSRYPSNLSTANNDNDDDTRDDTSLALAFANRSAALFSMNKYKLSLTDIDLAMSYNYPKENSSKLDIRKVKCLHILSIWDHDTELKKEELRKKLNDSSVSQQVKNEAQSMFEFLEKTDPNEAEKDDSDILNECHIKLGNSKNKLLPNGADCIEMGFNEETGRFIMTTKEVLFGRLIMMEAPFVCNLSLHLRKKYCYNCFTDLLGCGISCTGCSQVIYCTETCRDSKDEHVHECKKFLAYQNLIGVAYMVLHILFKVNINVNLIAVYKKDGTKMKTFQEVADIKHSDWPDYVYKSDYASIVSLMDHSSDYEFDDVYSFIITASYLMFALKAQLPPEIISKHFASKDDELLLGSVILKHLMQLQTNLVSILNQGTGIKAAMDQSAQPVIDEKPIGTGLYPTISLLNHSCTPNIFSIFHKNRFMARASKSLTIASEINYCYGPSVNRMSKKDRQAALKAQYFFDCKCESCSTGKEDERNALLCTKCNGPVIYSRDFSHECMKCHAKDFLPVKSVCDLIAQLSSKVVRIIESEGPLLTKIKSLEEVQSSLSKIAFWCNPLFFTIAAQLFENATELEVFDLAVTYCDQEQELFDRYYGPDSMETILLKMKHINVRWQKIYYQIEEKDDALKKEYVNALDDMIVEVTGIRRKLRDLLSQTNIHGAEESFDGELRYLSGVYNAISKYRRSLTDHIEESDRQATIITEIE